MATPLVDGDIVQLTVQAHQGSQLGEIVLNFRLSDFTGIPTDEDVAAFFDNNAASDFTPLIANTANYVGTAARILSRGGTFAPQFANTNAAAGLGGSQPLPGQVSGLVKYTTDTSGRIGHGRSYVPFPTVSELGGTTTNPTAGYIANVAAFVSDYAPFFTVLGGGGSAVAKLVVLTASTLAYRLVTGFLVEQGFATQRRRGYYGKPNT